MASPTPSLRMALYHRLLTGTVLLLALLLGVLYWRDFNNQLDLRLSSNKREVQLRAYAVDLLLSATEHWTVGLQKLAVGNAPLAKHSPLLQGILRQLAAPGGSALTFDSVPPPEGLGNLFLTHQPPDAELAQEIGIALGLSPILDVIVHNHPGIVASYYLSERRFYYYHPWVPSAQLGFAESMYQAEYYLNAKNVERNPQRTPLWSGIYHDHSGNGRIVTCSAPVDLNGQFLGAVAIDITVQTFHDLLVRHGPKDGTLYLVNGQGQVVASNRQPTPTENSLQKLGKLLTWWGGQGLPHGLGKTFAESDIDPQKALIDLGDAYQLSLPVGGGGGWRLVYVLMKQEARLKVLQSYQLSFALVGLCLTAAFLLPYWLIGREFLRPAQALLGLLEGKRLQGSVPARWRPWFERIRQLLGEHDQLVGLRHELDIARQIQQISLPSQPIAATDLEIAGRMQPASVVCGDGYDYFALDGRRVAIVIADVSGKGISAAIYMNGVRMLIRALAPSSADAADCLGKANRLLAANNEEMMFVTVFLGFLDRATGELDYANAGHHPPLWLGCQGQPVRLRSATAPALGPFGEVAYTRQVARLADGDRLLLFTDGVTEAFSPQGSFYGLGDILAHPPASQEDNIAWLDRIMASVHRFADGCPQADDITCLAVRFFAPQMLDLSLNCTDEASTRLGDVLARWAETTGFPSRQTHKAAIVLDELFSNAVRHGAATGQAVSIRLNAWQGSLVGEFRAPGPAFDPDQATAADLSLPLTDRPAGQLGLHLARKLSHALAWHYAKGENIYHFTILAG